MLLVEFDSTSEAIVADCAFTSDEGQFVYQAMSAVACHLINSETTIAYHFVPLGLANPFLLRLIAMLL